MFKYIFLLLVVSNIIAQNDSINKKYFSLGMRSTISGFSNDGWGIGTGGQFRIQLSNRVNTDWFADYITININNKKIKHGKAHKYNVSRRTDRKDMS